VRLARDLAGNYGEGRIPPAKRTQNRQLAASKLSP